MGRGRDMDDLRDVLRDAVRRIDPGGLRERPRVVEAWGRVAGEQIEQHALGYHLRDGELIVYVDSPVWATELSAMAEELRVRLNEDLGEELVRRLRFTVSKRVRERQQAQARRRREEAESEETRVEPVELTEQERAQVGHVAASVADPGLREAVLRAMTRDLEWKKGLRAAEERSREGGDGPREPAGG